MSRTSDPTVRAIEDALAFTTAAVGGDVVNAAEVARDALADDRGLFVDALVSTVQLLVEEASEAGADPLEALRDVALGVQVAHLSESTSDAPSDTDL